GHTSTAVAVWGSIYLYFARWTELIPALAGKKNRGGKEKKQWGHMVAIVFLITIPFSRMYLGRHFLGDVLGGYLLGFAILLLFYQGVYRNEPLMAFLFEKALYLRLNWKTMVTAIYFVLTPFLLLLLPLDPWQPKMKITLTALLLGMNLAFLLLWKRGLPKETGTFRQRALRTILGLFFFAAMVALFKGIALLLFTNEPMTARFIRLTFIFFFSFWGGIETAIKLKLMER
ncbi:MAG: phosphatase PAP2 family protein, partial [bacterium]|nr:phosphatase PAP2 family protein [bacterium]